MPKLGVIIGTKAESDLDDIYCHIATSEGQEQAELIQERLINVILTLQHLPARGKVPLEMLNFGINDFKEIQSPPWRILYYISGHIVGVVAVLDSRRNIAELLQKRLLQ